MTGLAWVFARRFGLACALAMAFAETTCAAAAPSRRVAIVAGVATYGGRGNLPNPVRDAREMGLVLGKLGFEVHVLEDPKSGAIEKAFADIATKGGAIDQLAFYFAGHGATVAGQSVLALNDGGPRQLVLAILPLSSIIEAAARLHPKAVLYMLEACRTDAGVHLPGSTVGLAAPPRATGSFFAYAAAPGDVAFDDPRKNTLTPFTLALLDELLVPNQDIGIVMRKVRQRVSTQTGGRELPWTEDSLTGPMILNQAPAAPALFALYGRALKGDAGAARDLGLAYLNGEGGARDIERGLALLQQAAAQKDIPALLSLGDFEAARDANALFPESKARGWYHKAAEAGSAEAWYRLAELDRKAMPREVEASTARPSTVMLDAYRHAAAGGNIDARARILALNLAYSFDKTRDRDKTIAALRPVAATGNVIAEATLGEAYSEPGKTQDFKEGDFWLAKAVAAGSTEALLSQAKNFGLGRGRPVDEPKATGLTLEAAKRGDSLAMLFLGRKLQHGTGVAPDKVAAVDWFRRATEAGEGEAFADLGFAYESGLGVDRDLSHAVASYRRGADLGDPVSTRYLAVMYEDGTGVRLNMDKAIGFYERAASLGDVRAKASLAVLATNGMLESYPDFKLGARLLSEAVAKSDDAEYIFKLAQMTEQGRGMRADPAAAAKLYARAYAFGSAEAAGELATLTLEGKGVAKDPAKAKDLYEKAAAAGDAVAYVDLAILARRRHDATHDASDLEDAGRWSRRGAEAGEPHAMSMYAGDLLLGQEGFSTDVDAAVGWFAKSLAAGNSNAADKLQAIVTDTTLDVPQAVRDKALLCLVKAATGGNALATQALRVIWQARNHVSMTKAPLSALETRLDGPEHAMIALLLGEGYADGRFDGRPDPAKAQTYLQMAADAGETQAWQQLGDLAASGALPDQGPKQAFADYKTGADAGEFGAMNDLGIAYAKGAGTPADAAKAFASFKQAAEGGYGAAMLDLALAYDHGVGTTRSPEDAVTWYQRAADAGNEGARLGLAGALLNRPPQDRDYSRALYNLFRLVDEKQPEAVDVLAQLCRLESLPKPVRARAALLLSAAREAMPDAAEPALDQMVAAHILKREGPRYVPVD